MQDETRERAELLEDLDAAPTNIPQTSPAEASPREYAAVLSRVTEENAQLRQDLDAEQRKNKTTEILDDLITPYASKAYWFMCVYCGFVGILLIANYGSWLVLRYKFGNEVERPIETSVIEFLVGSTAVTVIGLVGMVLTGIFVGARKR